MKFILVIVNMKIILFPKMKKVEKNISIEQKILLIKQELTIIIILSQQIIGLIIYYGMR